VSIISERFQNLAENEFEPAGRDNVRHSCDDESPLPNDEFLLLARAAAGRIQICSGQESSPAKVGGNFGQSRRFLTQTTLAFSLIVSFEGRNVIICPRGPSNLITGAAQRRTGFVREWRPKMAAWFCSDVEPRVASGSRLHIIRDL
jgi:hypothetical protein